MKCSESLKCVRLMCAAAAALYAQTAPDPSDILNRARFQISDEMRRLPKYTCVQTIERSYYTHPEATDCDLASAERKRGRTSLTLRAADRVRLNVAEGGGGEMHSWPGATHFETGDIDELVSRGPSATGAFGGYLVDIFDNGGAQFSFVGGKTEGARSVFTYGYRVEEEMSHYRVRTDEGWAIAGYDGTFDIDSSSLELLRITVNTLSLPRATGLCEAQSSIEYTRVPIGNGDFLLPRESKLHLSHLGTLETNSTSVFTSCREYWAVPAPPPMLPISPAGSKLTLPDETLLELLLPAIDSDSAAAGDPVTATVAAPVLDPKSHIELLPAGELVRGRISRMEHWLAPKPAFVIAIHWDSIANSDDSAPLSALLVKKPVPFRCEGATVFTYSLSLPGMAAGQIQGRRPPPPAELRETLPILPTNAQRCVVPDGQKIFVEVTSGGASK